MKVYFCDITKTDEAEFINWFGAMSNERKKAVEKLLVPHKQKLKIAADHISRKAISELCGISPESIVFSITEHGKPYVKELPFHFSISHSGDLVVCAVSDKEIGIDIEKIKKINPRISGKFASETESEYIHSHENGFFEIWTLKEAYFKCIGTGLGADIKNVCFDINSDGVSCSEKNFDCSFIESASGYICAVCEKTTENNRNTVKK